MLHGKIDTLADEFVATHIEQVAFAADGCEGFVLEADGGGFLIRFGEHYDNNMVVYSQASFY